MTKAKAIAYNSTALWQLKLLDSADRHCQEHRRVTLVKSFENQETSCPCEIQQASLLQKLFQLSIQFGDMNTSVDDFAIFADKQHRGKRQNA